MGRREGGWKSRAGPERLEMGTQANEEILLLFVSSDTSEIRKGIRVRKLLDKSKWVTSAASHPTSSISQSISISSRNVLASG